MLVSAFDLLTHIERSMFRYETASSIATEAGFVVCLTLLLIQRRHQKRATKATTAADATRQPQ